LALGVEPAEKNVMKRPPHPQASGIFGREMTLFIFIIGILMSIASIAAAYELWRIGDAAWQTTVFTVLVLTQLAVALESRSETESIFRLNFFGNRSMAGAILLTIGLQLAVVYTSIGNRIFETVPMPAMDVAVAVGAALLVILSIEIWKIFLRRKYAPSVE
jgi:Ca2+-transporting ATPase